MEYQAKISNQKDVRKRKKPGIAEIAEAAGVSRTTVSNVIHGRKGRMTEQTREKVLRIMEEEGFVPDLNAVSLAGCRSRIFGIFICDNQDYIHREYSLDRVLKVVEKEISRLNCSLIIHFVKDVEEVVEAALKWNMRAIFSVGFLKEQGDELIKRVDIPVGIMDSDFKCDNDFKYGYREGMYYRSRLFEKIHYFSRNETDITERWDGISKAFLENNLFDPDKAFSRLPKSRKERNSFYSKRLKELVQTNDLLIFEDEECASEAVLYMKESGIRIPNDVSVSGFDDERYAFLMVNDVLKDCV